jgi:hypothetical protein
MTDALHLLLTACVLGKGQEDAVFTRPEWRSCLKFP